MLTLRRGGARVISTGNLNSTQVGAVDYLNAQASRPSADRRSRVEERLGLDRPDPRREPDLILDNGGDMFVRWLERPYPRAPGGTEETTSGRILLAPLRDRLRMPILVINDSPIKQFAENRHAVGQSTVESFMRLTNMATNGRRVVVLGYGGVGKGLALNFRTIGVREPTRPADGGAVGTASRSAGCARRGGAVASRGHRRHVDGAPASGRRPRGPAGRRDPRQRRPPAGRDRRARRCSRSPLVAAHEPADDGITTLRLTDGRSIHLLTDGHMVNLAGPRPLGNSIESMDIGFSLQARCLEAIARGRSAPSRASCRSRGRSTRTSAGPTWSSRRPDTT